MRLLILSDLHVDRARFEPKKNVHYDAAVLAGDILEGGKVVQWVTNTFPAEKPIVLVLGNHEFYGRNMHNERLRLKAQAASTNVRILDRDQLILPDPKGGQLRVLGASLWTDFELPFSEGDDPLESNVIVTAQHAQKMMRDYTEIQSGNERPLQACETLEQHHIDRAWLKQKLCESFDGKTIVVTHHAPCVRSIPDRFLHPRLSAAYASDLPSTEFFGVASLWIHGHVHSSHDYEHFGTRVICNPRGGLTKDGSHENLYFNPALVVEV